MKAMLFRCLLAALLAFGTTVPAFATKDRLSDYDSTASGNEDVGGVNIQGTAPASNMDDGLREIMSHIADNFASDTIASATTTDIGAKSAHALTVTGTTTITGFGTVKAGTVKFLTFSGALTLTHNATSLILPGSLDITTVAGDTAVMRSEGSGNWRCISYQRVTRPPGGRRLATTAGLTGSQVTVTDIPSWVTEFDVTLDAVSTDGSGVVIIQIGDAGGIETTGYLGGVGNIFASSAANGFNTTGIQLPTASPTAMRYGTLTFRLVSRASNRWSISGIVFDSANSAMGVVGSIKSLSAPLDRIQITTADAFDGGTMHLAW